MKEVVEFLRKNPVQYFATCGKDGKPKVRPFQFMLEREGKLWFCTNSTKEVFRELTERPYAEICVSAPDYSWLRLSGETVFCDDLAVKAEIIEASPLVKQLYKTADNPIFRVFYLAGATAKLADFSGKPPRSFVL